MFKGWMRPGWALLCGAVLVFTTAGRSARADGPNEMEEMRQRLERLERMNQELLKRLDGQTLGGENQPVNAEGDDKAALGQDAVKKIVGDYLKSEAEKKKAKDEEQKKADAEQWYEVGKDLSMTARWNHGCMIETKDKAFRIRPTGRLQVDYVWMDAPANVMFPPPGGVGQVDDAVAFRRARVGAEGTFWEVINFWFEPDFFNTFNSVARINQTKNAAGLVTDVTAVNQTTTAPVPIDNWLEITKLPFIGTIRTGSVKPEYGLEHLTSSRFLDFMERSLLFDAYIGGLDNGFQPGAVVYNGFLDDRVRLAMSFTKNNESVFGFNVGDGEYNYVLRATALPVYEHNGRCLVHVGGSICHKDLDNQQYRFRSRTTLRNGPSALQTRLADITLHGSSIDQVLPEFAVTWGPFNMFAEWVGVWTSGVNEANNAFLAGQPVDFPNRRVFYQGFNVEALYFLTGEHRGYNKRMAAFDRNIPNENFFRVRTCDGICSGWGAWQVGMRYSWTDFNDAGIGGGIVHDWTFGVNWFLNPNFKIQANYVYNYRDIPGIVNNGSVQGFGIRTAMDF